MGIFDFFKKKETKQEIVEKLQVNQLNIILEEELTNLEDKLKNFRVEIKNTIKDFSSQIIEKLPELKLINLDKKREDENLKRLVMENLQRYISHLEELLADFEKIKEEDPKLYIEKTSNVFNRFSKLSSPTFERATILIGEELRQAKEIVHSFARNFNEKIHSGTNLFRRKSKVESIKLLLNEFNETKKIQELIESSIQDYENKIAKLSSSYDIANNEYNKIKQSKEYAKFLDEKEKIKQDKKNLNDEILRARQKINFKSLLKFFHENPKKREFIKEYSDNFTETLKSDDNLEISEILKQAKEPNIEIIFRDLRARILEKKQESIDPSSTFEDNIANLEHELSSEKNKLEKELEKKQKFEEKEKQILIQLKNDVKEIFSKELE